MNKMNKDIYAEYNDLLVEWENLQLEIEKCRKRIKELENELDQIMEGKLIDDADELTDDERID